MQCPPRTTLMYSHTKSLMQKKKKKDEKSCFVPHFENAHGADSRRAPTGAVVQELFRCPDVKVRCSCNASGQRDENVCVSTWQCTSNAFCLTAEEKENKIGN